MRNLLVLGALVLGLVFAGEANAFGGRSVSSQKIVTRNVQQVKVQKVRQVQQVQHVQQVRVQKVQVQPVIQYQYVEQVQQIQGHCPQNIQGLRSY